ncbi:SurA N-terminal domain-containing protein [Arenimonas sp. GDDSR-1]|uniref:SurA N-terminal domain-containing protein n=1 Tax=Arenimonas sp. GDDSR-1 TaxID=2950125 RepID=UPI002604269A|nr:SurA N-terminal domain-containing protein [Arenimonas sp. GDDSR-1]
MLQNIREKSSGPIAKLILVMIIAVMAFFGYEGMNTPGAGNYVAKVTKPGKFLGYGEDSVEVSMADYSRRVDQIRQQQRQQQGESFDAAAFEKPENKRRILEQMIDEAVMQLGAKQAGIKISDAMIRDEILKIDAFTVDGKFDQSRYQLAIQQLGYTPSQFEDRIRQDLMTRFIADEYVSSGIASYADAVGMRKLAEQKRDLSYLEVPLPALDANATDAELMAWYNSHKTEYRTEETVTIEYVELDQNAVQSELKVDEAVLRSRYEEQKAQYGTPEQRVASHILIEVPAGASAAVEAAAKAKAQAIAKQAQSNPGSFAEMAKNSDDLASKDAGGDLGPIEKGIFGDAFDKAFFALKPGQVSEPVRLEDGWHVLYYRELIAGTAKPFEAVRGEIEAAYLSSELERQFNELAGKMINAVGENASSLEPAAKAVGKPLLRSGAFTRRGGEGIAALEPIRKAAFSEDILVDRRVSDLIELEPNHVVILRVVDHKPVATLPFAQVKDVVRLAFVQDRAAKQAEKDAKALLQRLNKGETLEQLAAALSRPVIPALAVSRQAPVPQLQPVVQEAFRLARPENGKPGGAGIAKLPDGGYLLMQLKAVNEPDLSALPPQERSEMTRYLGQVRGAQQVAEYIKALRSSFKVVIAEDRL